MWEFRIPGLLLRWLARGPATRRYPYVKRPPFAATRGSISNDMGRCTLCTLCQKRCPTDAITVKRQEKTWSIDRLRCTACRACVDPCPAKSLAMLPAWTDPPLKKSVDVYSKPEAAPKGAPDA